jgi:hypothetical protein
VSTVPLGPAWRQLLSDPSLFWSGGRLPATASESLAQSVPPGWNFGTIVNLTEENSAPQIEAAVLQKQSYGRQLGQITDALQVLITERARTGKRGIAALTEVWLSSRRARHRSLRVSPRAGSAGRARSLRAGAARIEQPAVGGR